MKGLIYLLITLCSISVKSQSPSIPMHMREDLYESILNVALKSENLNRFDNKLKLVGFVREPGSYIKSNKEYYETTYLSDGAEIVTYFSNPSGEIRKMYLLHDSDMKDFILNYLKKYTKKNNSLWINYLETIAFAYEPIGENNKHGNLIIFNLSSDW